MQALIDLMPEWPRFSERLERIVLTPGGDSSDGSYEFFHREETGAIHLHAWPEDLWIDLGIVACVRSRVRSSGQGAVMVSGERVPELVNGDFELRGLAWEEGGRDLVLELRLPDGQVGKLRCTWATGVDIHLRMEKDDASLPLSWDASFEPSASGTWAVRLDFAGNGKIGLVCNEVEWTVDEGR